jgi:hypothetical protein
MCANNYLGLANNREIIEAVKTGLDERGFGMASVRFICGTQDIHHGNRGHSCRDCIRQARSARTLYINITKGYTLQHGIEKIYYRLVIK